MGVVNEPLAVVRAFYSTSDVVPLLRLILLRLVLFRLVRLRLIHLNCTTTITSFYFDG